MLSKNKFITFMVNKNLHGLVPVTSRPHRLLSTSSRCLVIGHPSVPWTTSHALPQALGYLPFPLLAAFFSRTATSVTFSATRNAIPVFNNPYPCFTLVP